MDKGLLIITGLSGAGKSLALSALEDVGFFCIDNMPAPLVIKFLEMKDDFLVNNQKIACVIDIRNGENNTELFQLVAELQKEAAAKIVFLDANEKVILDRYKETRRKHPVMLRKNLSLEEAVKYEKEALHQLYAQADYILDTTLLSTAQLKDRILSFAVHDVKETITIDVISFGFKFGVPSDVDVMFDVRCFLNPFYVKGLREKTGNDEEIVDFVFSQPEAKTLLEKYIDDAFLAGLKTVHVIHGRGEGILRNGLRADLKKNKHVKSFQSAPYSEGGEGCTIVELKDRK